MELDYQKAGFFRNASYETFMLAVSLLSFVNLIIILSPVSGEPNKIVTIMDIFISCIFLFDFITRLIFAKQKSVYFFKQYGWSDMLASIPLPLFNIFRIFRVVRFGRIMRRNGYHKVLVILFKKLSSTALYVVFFLILLVLEFGSMGVLITESSAENANITTASDALWWAFVSIATVGYGDYFPVTNPGRVVGVFTIAVGVGLFGVVTGYLANVFLGSNGNDKKTD
jgi:hypothetical protein